MSNKNQKEIDMIVGVLKPYFYHEVFKNSLSGKLVWHLCSQKEVEVTGLTEKEQEELYKEIEDMATEILSKLHKDEIELVEGILDWDDNYGYSVAGFEIQCKNKKEYCKLSGLEGKNIILTVKVVKDE